MAIGLLAAAAGVVAKSATNLITGLTSSERKEVRAAKKEAKAEIKAAKKEPVGIKTESPSTGAARKTGKDENKPDFMVMLKKYWYVVAIAGALFVYFFVIKKKNNPIKRRRTAGRSGTAWSRKMYAAKMAKRKT